jgi:hypothetical protein
MAACELSPVEEPDPVRDNRTPIFIFSMESFLSLQDEPWIASVIISNKYKKLYLISLHYLPGQM